MASSIDWFNSVRRVSKTDFMCNQTLSMVSSKSLKDQVKLMMSEKDKGLILTYLSRHSEGGLSDVPPTSFGSPYFGQ